MPLFGKTARKQVLNLPIEAISPNPYQPRRQFDPAALEDLAYSIGELGMLQPLSVRKTERGWELIAGERRLRAAKLAGLSSVPCIPTDAGDEASSLLALVENLQREDLDVWEEAEALHRLMEDFGLTQEEAARRVGKSQSAVANKLRLLRLPEDVIASLREHRLTERHARALLKLDTADLQRKALAHIIKYKFNVARAELYIESLCRQDKPRSAVPIYRTRDVRLFLNTVKRGLSIMQSSGVNARWAKEDLETEYVVTIRIPK